MFYSGCITNILLIFCLLNVSVLSLTFVADNSSDEHWTFVEGSIVKLVCTNYPYTGIIRFLYNFALVFKCTGSDCESTQEGNNLTFSFEHDTENGIFTWMINKMTMAYNKKEFGCFDGTDLISFNATVKELADKNNQERLLIVLIPVSACAVLSVIIIIIVVVVITKRYCSKTYYRTNEELTDEETVGHNPLENSVLLQQLSNGHSETE